MYIGVELMGDSMVQCHVDKEQSISIAGDSKWLAAAGFGIRLTSTYFRLYLELESIR